MKSSPPQKTRITLLLYAGFSTIVSSVIISQTGSVDGKGYSRPAFKGESILTLLFGALLIALYFISDRFPGTYRDISPDYHTVEYDFSEQFIRHVVEQMYLVECFIFEQGMLGDQIPFKRIEYPEIIAREPALVFEKPDETLLIIELFHLANGKYINSDEVVVERGHQQFYLRLVPIPAAMEYKHITE
jgi:hypothetical protein